MAFRSTAVSVDSFLGREKSHNPVRFPSPRGLEARHMDISRSASVSSVAFSVDVCVCMCVFEAGHWEQMCIC